MEFPKKNVCLHTFRLISINLKSLEMSENVLNFSSAASTSHYNDQSLGFFSVSKYQTAKTRTPTA